MLPPMARARRRPRREAQVGNRLLGLWIGAPGKRLPVLAVTAAALAVWLAFLVATGAAALTRLCVRFWIELW